MVTAQQIGVLSSDVLHRMAVMVSGPHLTTPPDVYATRRRFSELSDTHPVDWFWTDACPSPDDDVTLRSVEPIEPREETGDGDE
jgi:hypothetical protein